VTLARWHGKLKKAMGAHVKLPTAQQENAKPDEADSLYETCSTFLRGVTRDQKKFPLLFAENCGYGMRRNLWAMKPVGIGISLTGLLVVAIIGVVDPARQEIAAAAAVVDIALLLGWLFIFTPAWVRVPADAYAERLLEACDKL
jgi:hypothetical protein